MRDYTLLTGATGLLGAYLLRNLLLDGTPCAVLVRANRMESAVQRVESVLSRFERETGVAIPRPVVLEGSLSENLGLDAEATAWVKRRCVRILHNAASLTFVRDPQTNEPYRSNVDGVRFAVDFALDCKIPQFHHVSTAYVCGLRTGVCREDELDVGQSWGNDYEKAKVEAEKIVRAAGFQEAPTFYRPAIITGDSVNGYTSTYHGFYTPLKVASALVAQQEFRGSADDIIHFLGMRGDEHKNFVPVEWVARLIAKLIACPKSIGKTFHLTPKNRPTVGEMYEVFTEALQEYGKRQAESSAAPKNAKPLSAEVLEGLLTSFRDQMKVYSSYWRDDPTFDTTNTDVAAPDLPCPEMSRDVLKRLSTFALDVNFGWPKPRPAVPKFFVRDLFPVEPSLVAIPKSSDALVVSLSALGPGGGEWTAVLEDNSIAYVEEGRTDVYDASLSTSTTTLDALRSGALSARDAVNLGAIVWQTSNSSLQSASIAVRFLTVFIASLKSTRGERR